MSDLHDRIVAALRTVQDPEIPINLFDLGLIYDVAIGEDGLVAITMTLTTPNCPVAESMPGRVRAAVESVEGVAGVDVRLVWDPPWSKERMPEAARAALEMMGVEWSDLGKGGGATPLTVRGRRERGD